MWYIIWKYIPLGALCLFQMRSNRIQISITEARYREIVITGSLSEKVTNNCREEKLASQIFLVFYFHMLTYALSITATSINCDFELSAFPRTICSYMIKLNKTPILSPKVQISCSNSKPQHWPIYAGLLIFIKLKVRK